jgi:hypothetical protein
MKRLLPILLLVAACGQTLPVTTTATSPLPTPGPSRPSTPAPTPTATPTPTAVPTATPSPRSGWLIFGDSITQNSFHDSVAWDETWGAGAPPLVGFGIRGADGAYALTQEDELLARYPGPGPFGLAFGTNDVGHARTPEAFKASLLAMANRAIAAGRGPVLVATIPYSPHPDYQAIPAFNMAIAESGLRLGPDLYTWFKDHPDQISPDKIHPTDEGNAAVQRLWAEAAMANRF